jgi:hypothetical protein
MRIERGVLKAVCAETCFGAKADWPITGNLSGRFASLAGVGDGRFPDDALPRPSLARETVQFSGA